MGEVVSASFGGLVRLMEDGEGVDWAPKLPVVFSETFEVRKGLAGEIIAHWGEGRGYVCAHCQIAHTLAEVHSREAAIAIARVLANALRYGPLLFGTIEDFERLEGLGQFPQSVEVGPATVSKVLDRFDVNDARSVLIKDVDGDLVLWMEDMENEGEPGAGCATPLTIEQAREIGLALHLRAKEKDDSWSPDARKMIDIQGAMNDALDDLDAAIQAHISDEGRAAIEEAFKAFAAASMEQTRALQQAFDRRAIRGSA